MFRRNRLEALRRERDGLVSRILWHEGDLPETQLTVTWVEVAPGSGQRSHSHEPEQVYVIVISATPPVDWEAFYDKGPLRTR